MVSDRHVHMSDLPVSALCSECTQAVSGGLKHMHMPTCLALAPAVDCLSSAVDDV